jgi:hypothetical protein
MIGNAFAVDVPSAPVFSVARLAEIQHGIDGLRAHWREHAPGFFTLGLAHYKDGRDGLGAPEIEASNARLAGTFGPALEDLRTYLEAELDRAVEWGAGLPLPGFHILDARALRPGRPAGDSHFDLQYTAVRFDAPVDATLSFTVPIRVPSGGATLEHWPVDFAELRRRIAEGAFADLEDAQRRLPMHAVAYEPGRVCLQRGLPLHRMGTVADVGPSDRRITLQGHAALVGDRWVGYW